METVTDMKISEQTVNRWLKQLKTESVDIYPGYKTTRQLGLLSQNQSKNYLLLFKIDRQLDISVFFMVFPAGKDKHLFEISYKTSVKYIYKNKKIRKSATI